MDIYAAHSIPSLLSGNPYPGRGIIIGMTPDGKKAAFAYFIMGRSENSRNRVFIPEGRDLRTAPFDASKVKDPSLIIYYPVRDLGKIVAVTNGDQTDTIRDYILNGSTFEAALDTRCFEPDGPNWTPRISGLLCYGEKSFRYKLSILKSLDAEGSDCVRETFTYPAKPGLGHFLHTYVTDGNPIPTFQGEPERVEIPACVNCLTEQIWENLDENNKISLYVRTTDLETGEIAERLINKHEA
ncbi:MAG: IMP cyclohydrolase [Clostridia bacterium]|nr:IMP cyclohydrolase [Clostridia bacterium]